jgi:hypothetical protein
MEAQDESDAHPLAEPEPNAADGEGVTLLDREPVVDGDIEPDGDSVDEPHCDREAQDESDGDTEAVTDALVLREGEAEGVLDGEGRAVALPEK